MEAIGLLYINFLYIVFFVLYFLVAFVLYGTMVVPYFLINTTILIVEFITLSSHHNTFVVFIGFNILFLIYASKKRKKVLKTLPIVALIPFVLLLFIGYIGKFYIVFLYLFNIINFVILSLLLILVIAILLKVRKLNIYSFSVMFFIYIIISAYIAKNDITKISIEKFGLPPKYINIDFSIYDDFRHPHALVVKNKSCYYWSFKHRGFIKNNRLASCMY